LFPRHLLGRVYLLAGVLSVDCALLAAIPHARGLFGPLAPSTIVALAIFLGLGYSKLKANQEELPFGGWLFAAHFACIAIFFFCNFAVLHSLGAQPSSLPALLGLAAPLVVGVGLLGLACIPYRTWIATRRATGTLWLYATLAGLGAWCLRFPLQQSWIAHSNFQGRFLQTVTYHCVHAILRLFLPDLIGSVALCTIGTPRFPISIGPQCSGVEGLGLVLVFTTVWLWYFRKENRFPQAFLLIPCALASVWLLNIVRIVVLVLIGNAGAPEIAIVGFHSQAGWIAFTLVALAFSMASQKIAWVRKPPSSAANLALDATGGVAGADVPAAVLTGSQTGESPATGAYLLPFLAILGASFLSKAASGYFEWLYPLRFVAAVIAIWNVRSELKKLNWRFGWLAPVVGTAIFFLWIAPVWWTHQRSASTLGAALAGLPFTARWVWILFRATAAVVTVPIAEELAFRGYLARRLVNRDFTAVPFAKMTLLSVGLSSVAFGLMHGQHWLAGIVAGLAYAGALKWRGRIGDAVVAHATSNLLLAAWVLILGDWAQW
jgi:exosortase E/protease (VPEID-CTERM system)